MSLVIKKFNEFLNGKNKKINGANKTTNWVHEC